jgi:signal transduction histidine kinase
MEAHGSTPGTTNDFERLVAAVARSISVGADAHQTARRVLTELANGGDQIDASLYLLTLSDLGFRLFDHVGATRPAESLPLSAAAVSADDLTPSDVPLLAPDGALRLQLPRGGTVVGLLEVSPGRAVEPLFGRIALRNVVVAALVRIYEREFATRLLGGIQRPVPFDRDEEWFLRDLLRLVRESSGMPFAAIREWDGKQELRCLGADGFGEWGAANEELTFREIDDHFEPFARALRTGKPVAELDLDAPQNQWLRSIPSLHSVKSYVVAPMKVGGDVLGTVSLATAGRYPFTSFEQQGFESLANGIGIAIANFRNYHDMTQRFGDVAVGVTALEIATAVRHATASILDRSGYYLKVISREAVKPTTAMTDAVSELRTELGLLDNELYKFKVATERPQRDLKAVNIKEQWTKGKNTLSGRLKTLEVRPVYDGPDIEIVGYPDWIGHLFLNLMLNSLDAFERMSRKGRREVRLRVSPPSPSENSLRMVYSDNGPGISPTGLVGGQAYVTELPLRQRIFEAHVTSKRDPDEGYLPLASAGLGLFLVRKVMADHQGSIDWVESHEGAAFRILFPMRLLVAR